MSDYIPLTRSPSHRAGPIAIRSRRRSSVRYYEEPEFDSEFATHRRQDGKRQDSGGLHRLGSSYSQSVYAPEEQARLANGYVGGYGSPPVAHRRRAISHSHHLQDREPFDGMGYENLMGPGHYGPQVAGPGSLPVGQPMFNNGPVTGHPHMLNPHMGYPHMSGSHWGANAMPGMIGGMGDMGAMSPMGGIPTGGRGGAGLNALGVPYPNSMPLGGMSGGAPLPGLSDYGRPKWGHFVKPDYRRACFKYGSADVPYASLPGGPLEGMPAQLSSQMYARM